MSFWKSPLTNLLASGCHLGSVNSSYSMSLPPYRSSSVGSVRATAVLPTSVMLMMSDDLPLPLMPATPQRMPWSRGL